MILLVFVLNPNRNVPRIPILYGVSAVCQSETAGWPRVSVSVKILTSLRLTLERRLTKFCRPSKSSAVSYETALRIHSEYIAFVNKFYTFHKVTKFGIQNEYLENSVS